MKIRIRRPDDFHVHFRRGDMLRLVVPHTASQFSRALVMPNTTPPVRTADDVARYRREILDAAGPEFTPLMTIKLLPETTPDTIRVAKGAGVVAAKLYPQAVTHNADDGVPLEGFPVTVADALGAMEEAGMVLSIHGERPRVYYADREDRFLPLLDRLVQAYPRLRVVVEHITTEAAVRTVRRLPDTVAATITVHHLLITGDHVLGELDGRTAIRPHFYCLPVAKRPEDRDALVSAAVSGDPSFFFGSDSAPHPLHMKECAEGCGGIFTAPVALPLLVDLFEGQRATDRLENFVSQFGAAFYGLPLNEGSVEFIREPWTVPDRYGDVVPFRAGNALAWRVTGFSHESVL